MHTHRIYCNAKIKLHEMSISNIYKATSIIYLTFFNHSVIYYYV